MRTREDIEAFEEKYLAPYAMRSKDSVRREFDEPKHEFRTCYQRDRDRIVHSEAFRKLEYKTQVFIIFEGDYYRTRLTHTIEVAQIGRTIGRNLGLNEDLIEAIALAHDLGHPPFGHAGEEILDRIMKEYKFGEFNHNKRSYEIVSKFEKRYPDYDGLNLTQEVIIGILKHETKYDIPDISNNFLTDEPTLEARVVDIADSLAYLNHDIDDGLTSGCIVESDLVESDLWNTALKKIEGKVKGNNREMLKYQIVKQLIDMQIKDLLATTDKRFKKANFQSAEDAKKSKEKIIGFSADMAQARNMLQDLLNKKLYHHYRVVRMTSKAQRIIQDLFEAYVNEPQQLPYSVYDRGTKHSQEEKYKIICHHIAGMTDRAALDEHKRFFNPYTKV